MALVEGWMPPSRENYETLMVIWQYFFPILGFQQWFFSWYGMGKTSDRASSFNLPGRLGWMLMESPGFVTLLYVMLTLPAQEGIHDLPWQNLVLAGLFVFHYIYRAVLFPLMQPSMAPIHIGICLMAATFQLLNATCLASHLAAYGPAAARRPGAGVPAAQFAAGLVLFYLGLVGNWFHDEALRDIRRRRRRSRSRNQKDKPSAGTTQGHYEIPTAGLFQYILYPHYLLEWLEWFGFWMAAGWDAAPARAFLVNEIFAMLPRAVSGKRWYVEKFGPEKIRKKWAIIPGVC